MFDPVLVARSWVNVTKCSLLAKLWAVKKRSQSHNFQCWALKCKSLRQPDCKIPAFFDAFPMGTHKILLSPNSAKVFFFWQNDLSIKHDLARSCFQLWPKIGDEGDSRPERRKAETGFSQNFVARGADFEGHNWNLISPVYVLCYKPQAKAILSNK